MKSIRLLITMIFLFCLSTLINCIELPHKSISKLPTKLSSTSNLPLYFIKNMGQVNNKALFYSKTSGYTLWIAEDGLVFDSVLKAGSKRSLYKLSFRNANKKTVVEEFSPSSYKVNFFKGKDRSKWIRSGSTSKAVIYRELYKNIDLKIYGKEKCIEYDWIVKPGGNPADIKFHYEHAESTSIDESGNILIRTEAGKIIHKAPVSYQNIDGRRVAVKSFFIKNAKNRYRIKTGIYNSKKDLIIDPVVLLYSSYLGGSGNDHVNDMTIGNDGSIYLTGYTWSENFPVHNAYQSSRPPSSYCDTFITKISPDGRSLIYSTYIGGSGQEISQSIKVDSSGSAYITGSVTSNDFPITGGAFQAGLNGSSDSFIAKLSPSGSSLTYSTYLGGSSSEEAFGIDVDSSGNAYVAGATSSADFPLANPFQPASAGGDEVFVTKISSNGSSIIYSTYLGGSNFDKAFGIAVDNSGNAYVTGNTQSGNFPLQTPFQSGISTSGGAFVTKLNSSGNSLGYSTHLGGNSFDYAWDIEVDSSGSAYVVCSSSSTDFPTKNSAQSSSGGSYDATITKFSPSGNTLIYSSYFGGSGTDQCYAVAVNNSGEVAIAGETNSTTPSVNSIQSHGGGDDGFIARFSSNGANVLFASNIGGSHNETIKGVAIDNSSNVYVAGHTVSTNFPVKNSFQSSHRGGSFDTFFAKLGQPEISLKCELSLNNDFPLLNETFNLKVKVTNSSSVSEDGITLTDKIPDGCLYVSSSPSAGTYDSSTGIWSIGSLGVGSSAEMTLELKMAKDGIFNYTAHLVSTNDTSGQDFSKKISSAFPINATSSGTDSTVTPETQKVSYGNRATISINLKEGHEIVSITDNSVEQSVISPYYIENVKEKHNVAVVFDTIKFSVTSSITEGAGKTETPSQTIDYGTDATINIIPDPGYKIIEIKDNDNLQTINNPYIIKAVKENHKVEIKLEPTVDLIIEPTRKTVSAWLISKEYGSINLTINDPASATAELLLEYSTDGTNYNKLTGLKPQSFTGTSHTYNHKYLDKNKKYKYRLTAYDSSGKILAQQTTGESI